MSNDGEWEAKQAYIEAAIEEALGREAWITQIDVHNESHPQQIQSWEGPTHFIPGPMETEAQITVRLGRWLPAQPGPGPKDRIIKKVRVVDTVAGPGGLSMKFEVEEEEEEEEE